MCSVLKKGVTLNDDLLQYQLYRKCYRNSVQWHEWLSKLPRQPLNTATLKGRRSAPRRVSTRLPLAINLES